MSRIECPHCGKELTSNFGDDAYCDVCDKTFETDFELISDDVGYVSWITGEKTSTNEAKTEERAREYAGKKPDESRRGFMDFIYWELKYKSFIDGYNSRNSEVAELKKALKKITDFFDSPIPDGYIYDKFDELGEAIDQAKRVEGEGE